MKVANISLHISQLGKANQLRQPHIRNEVIQFLYQNVQDIEPKNLIVSLEVLFHNLNRNEKSDIDLMRFEKIIEDSVSQKVDLNTLSRVSRFYQYCSPEFQSSFAERCIHF